MLDRKIDFNNIFVVTFGWMRYDLKLKGNDLDVFAVIFSFEKDDSSKYFGTINYLAQILNVSDRMVCASLKKLTESNYLVKTFIETDFGKRPTYKVNSKILKTYKKYLNNPIYEETSELKNFNYEETSIGYEETSIYNINNNINNNFLSKSNELDLSKKLASSEELTCNDDTDSVKNNYTAMPSVYESVEKNKIDGREETEVAADDAEVDFFVNTEQEQLDIDKINALKLFKKTTNKNNKHKKETEFVKCAKLINSNPNYSNKLKDLLYKYLKFRITRRGLTEDVWKQLLSQLEEAISNAPTRDNDKLNYLREFTVNSSLCAQYNTFYPINERKLVELLSSYNPRMRGLAIDQDGLPRQSHGPIDRSKLAVNPDGTPMIF